MTGKRALLGLVAAMIIGSDAGADEGLERYAWDARLLVVFAADENEGSLQRQRADIAVNRDGYRDRDVIVLVFAEDDMIDSIPHQNVALDPADLRHQLTLPNNGFAVALLGKDTGVKLRSAEPVGACEIFALIDGMPMRRSEIARNNGAVPCR